jgi:hypothetical protein
MRNSDRRQKQLRLEPLAARLAPGRRLQFRGDLRVGAREGAAEGQGVRAAGRWRGRPLLAFRKSGPDAGDGLREGDVVLVEPGPDAPAGQLAFTEVGGRLTVRPWPGSGARQRASGDGAQFRGVVRGWVRRRPRAARRDADAGPTLLEYSAVAARRRRLQQRLLALRATYLATRNARLRRALEDEGRRLRAELGRVDSNVLHRNAAKD